MDEAVGVVVVGVLMQLFHVGAVVLIVPAVVVVLGVGVVFLQVLVGSFRLYSLLLLLSA